MVMPTAPLGLVGAVPILLFLPALHAVWYRVKPALSPDTVLGQGHQEAIFAPAGAE